MRWLIRDFAGSGKRVFRLAVLVLLMGSASYAQTVASFNGARSDNDAKAPKISVPTGPPKDASGVTFRDGRYGVRFQVPPGWNFTRKDREVSTFRLDARTAPKASEMRAVASMGFNPFPRSVLSGALVYFSVARHSNDKECAEQATAPQPEASEESEAAKRDPTNIGGMEFVHGHDEHGGICVEARDEVYTAYRKGSCYRFDLAVNTFCSVSSGASELSREQMRSIEAQMVGILSTVALDWEKTGPQAVPVPEIAPGPDQKASPRRQIPVVPAGQKSVVGRGA